MYLAYSFLLTLGLLVLIPRFAYQAIAHGKYVSGFWERFGSLPAVRTDGKPVIWLHCVSVGETQAARPLVDRLLDAYPNHILVVSTITRTGQQLARDVFKKQAAAVFYFPFDWGWSVRRSLRSVSPRCVLVMETELWPNFLRECKRRKIPVALVNGRISRQSFRRYGLIKSFMQRVLACLNIAIMQSEQDAARISALASNNVDVVVGGNIKFDLRPLSSTPGLTNELQARFGLTSDVALIVAASTHAPEERIIIETFRTLKYRQHHRARLVIVPRHPERFEEVAGYLKNSALKWTRRTAPPSDNDPTVDVLLLDTIGELPATYALATIVFVGGSIVDKGGHNVLEPASVGKAVVTGYYTHNFQAIIDLMNEGGAIVQMPHTDMQHASERLREIMDDLLIDAVRRDSLGSAARQLVIANRGAAETTVKLLKSVVDGQ